MKQEYKVYLVLQELGGRARSEEIKRACLNSFNGVSCPDRYLRFMMVKDREIIENIGKVKPDDKTDTYVVRKPYTPAGKKPDNHGDLLFDVNRYSYD